MDKSSLTGAFLSSMTSGFVNLEPSSQRHQQAQSCHRPNTHDDDRIVDSTQKSVPMNFGKGKGVPTVNFSNLGNMSEDDEQSYHDDGICENLDRLKGKDGSPWQRMKWTDEVIRLLIQVVACVGEDGSFDGAEGLKRKSAVVSQKKGKWKTVSQIMISKGCHVSPQQCEDKFNDLNKRYKKLNDLLGRGISSRVVEDPSILDTLRRISPKMKDDVRRILSSKHLFYHEMCAYHSGQKIPNCGDLDLQVNSLPPHSSNLSLQVNSSPPNSRDLDLQVNSLPFSGYSKEKNDSEEGEGLGFEIVVTEDDESGDEDHSMGGVLERMREYNKQGKQNREEFSLWPQPSVLIGFQAEIAEVSEDPPKSQWEGKPCIQRQMLQLQEQRVRIQAEAFELAKRCFKWRRFCSKKESELERLRLDNERMLLENERMVLQLKHEELDIGSKILDAPSDPRPCSADKLQGRSQIDLGSHL